MFSHLVEKPDEKLLRLRITQPHPSQKYDGINIFDTPGYNSLITEHEEVLRNFIPEMRCNNPRSWISSWVWRARSITFRLSLRTK